MNKRVLTIDIGSSNLRAMVWDPEDMVVVARASRWHRPAPGTTAPGSVDAIAMYRCLVDLLDELQPASIDVVVVCSLWQSVMLTDVDWRPLSATLTWESRLPVDIGAKGATALQGLDVAAAAGVPWHSSTPAAAALTLLNGAGHPSPKAHLVDLSGWLLGQLTDGGVDAARWSAGIATASGLWNQQDGTWDGEILAALGIVAEHVGEPWTQALASAPETARRWPGLAQARWLPALGDGLCHNLGDGCVEVGHLAVMVGTSGSLRRVSTTAPPLQQGLWRYQSFGALWASGGAITSAGNVCAWLERIFPTANIDARLQAEVPLLPQALLGDASVYGRRGPDYPWHSSGSLSGMHGEHSAADLKFVLTVEMLRPFYQLAAITTKQHDVTRVRLAGGASREPNLPQLIADATGLTLEVTHCAEASSRGAALVGAAAVDVTTPMRGVLLAARRLAARHPPRVIRSIAPRESWRQELMRRWG